MPFALKKILGAVLLLLVFSFVVFVALDLSSGSVLSGIYGDGVQSANPLLKARLLENLGLDRPLLVRYLEWLGRILRGDLGVSLASGERVIDILKEGLPYTLVLGLTSFALSFIFALVLGTIGAYFKDSWLDKTIIYTTLGFFSVPSFWLGLVAIMLFSVLLGWLPSSGVGEIGATPTFGDLARHLLLPVCVLTLAHLAIYTRLVRSVVLDTLQEPFVLSYQAWGVSALWRFYLVLRFCFLPIVGYFASNAGVIVGGTYVVESVFSIGGIGQSTINALLHKDYPLALSIIMLSAFFVVGLNVLVELLARWLNPKW
ncbi:ABC transporter permease [Helicobacter heilmannii]|uniref:ABC transporter permease n=1 Tax=Helicobacter heilmannii TaxID=35817 RepID=UPI000CF09566|nr:ABC transporter permease [Helicobacter heilmannii]